MTSVDFTKSVMRSVSFYDLDLSGCRLTNLPGHIFLKDRFAIANQVLKAIDSHPEDLVDLRVAMRRQIAESGKVRRGPGIEFIDDLGANLKERTFAVQLLEQAGAIRTG